MKKNTFVVILSLVISLMCTVGLAQAAPYIVGSGWSDFFNHGDVGSSWDRTYDFTLTAPAILRVTDLACYGDQYNVTDNGVSLGNSSVPATAYPPACPDSILDADVAFADSRWSSGWWVLPAGSHSISGIAIQSPYTMGGGTVRVDNAANCFGSLCYQSISGAGWHRSQCIVYVPGMMGTINVGQVTYAGCTPGSCPKSFCIVVTP
jgi:hypothetical protein